jgi:hypothetical protein
MFKSVSALATAVSAAFLLASFAASEVQAQAAITIADSVADFSGTQGQDGWFYGYYRRSGDTGGYDANADFRLLPTHRAGDGSGVPGGWILDESRFYTGIDSDQQHGNGAVSGVEDVEHWAVRRYVAETSGAVTIAGFTREDAKIGPNDDGTIAKILINGTEVFSRDIAPEDQTPNPYAVLANVEVGDKIDFVMLPGANDYYDCPFFTAVITVVPEPATAGLLAAGAVALLARRRRR